MTLTLTLTPTLTPTLTLTLTPTLTPTLTLSLTTDPNPVPSIDAQGFFPTKDFSVHRSYLNDNKKAPRPQRHTPPPPSHTRTPPSPLTLESRPTLTLYPHRQAPRVLTADQYEPQLRESPPPPPPLTIAPPLAPRSPSPRACACQRYRAPHALPTHCPHRLTSTPTLTPTPNPNPNLHPPSPRRGSRGPTTCRSLATTPTHAGASRRIAASRMSSSSSTGYLPS